MLANTFYSHFVYEALARHGRFAEALRLMRERYGPMLARGATTLWESFEPTASLCHGFSATPTYQLSRRMLGVAPAAPGFAEIELAPDLAGLDHAEGVVPTPRGDVGRGWSAPRTASSPATARRPASAPAPPAARPGDRRLAGPDGDRIEIRFERTSRRRSRRGERSRWHVCSVASRLQHSAYRSEPLRQPQARVDPRSTDMRA